HRRRVQRRGGRRDRRGVGRARRVDLQRRHLAGGGRTARHRAVGVAPGGRRQPDRRVPRCTRRRTRDGRRWPPDLHRLGPGGAAAFVTGTVLTVDGGYLLV